MDHRRPGSRRFTLVIAVVAAAAIVATMPNGTGAQDPPRPIRLDRPQAGREFLVLRPQKLRKGAHPDYLELSRDGVWPFYEKIGTRVVGQWQVVHPEGGGSDAYDAGYRLARYRSFNHWAATRNGAGLGGDGRDYEAMIEAARARAELELGSDGPIFLEGYMAGGGPYFLPGLDERYQLAPARAPRS